MVVSFAAFVGRRPRALRRLTLKKSVSERRTRGEAGPVLVLVALGSVAFLMWQAQRRAKATAAEGTLIRPPPPADVEQAFRVPPASAPPDLGRPIFRELEPESDDVATNDVLSVPAYSGLALTELQRAAVAIQLGQPSDLRRIALEMELAGQDIEAGLLNNYALLLERSRNSRPRVLAEVTRMLQAALATRREAHRERPPSAVSSEPGAEPNAPRLAGESVASPQAPLVPMPVLAVGEKRRAG
jgi:hypothetical protein